MNSDAKILKYSKFVSMDYMLGLDLETVLGLAYNDLRNKMAESFMENIKTSKEYIVKFDYTTNEDQPELMYYRLDGYLSMQPVWHGHWVTLLNGNIQCSECGYEPYWDSGAWQPHYCPNCGANMDEVSE